MRALLIIAVTILHSTALNMQAGGQSLAQKLIGEWEGSRHVEAYYLDGSFSLDPRPGDRPLGTWKLAGHRLTTQLDEEDTPMVVLIDKITDTEMVTIYKGRRFSHKRVAHQ